MPSPKITYSAVIYSGQPRIFVSFDFDAQLNKRMGKVTGAKWSNSHTCWHITDMELNWSKCKLPEEIKELLRYLNIKTTERYLHVSNQNG
jgi:hypothetical protein